MNEAEVFALLRLKYPEEEYALFRHVSDGTGAHQHRWIDAWCMSLWPSRGMETLGFEIKCDRADWVREKSNPEKAEAIARFCDGFYLVAANDKIVHDDELPAGWGLMVVDKGGKLRVSKKAPKLEPQPLSRYFLAAVLRAAQKVSPDAGGAIQSARNKGFKEGVEAGKKEVQYRIDSLQNQLDAEKKTIADFEKASGITMNRWQAGNIGAAVKAFMDGGYQVNGMLQKVREIAQGVRALVRESDATEKSIMAAIEQVGKSEAST